MSTLTEHVMDVRSHIPATELASYDDLGECRRVASARVRAFRATGPVRVIDRHGHERAGREGDVLIVTWHAGSERAGDVELVDRDDFERWYEPAAALEPSRPENGGPVRDRDVICACRLAVVGAGNDRAARMAVQLLLDRAAPTTDGNANVAAVQALVDVVKSSRELRFEMVAH